MGKVKSQRGRTGTRDQAFFPGLSGFQRGIDKVIAESPKTVSGKAARTQADIDDLMRKREAKLARRAKAAKP